jgi:hypothetical protein
MRRHSAMGIGSANALTTQTKDINVGTGSNKKKSFGLHCKIIRLSRSAVREFKLFFV